MPMMRRRPLLRAAAVGTVAYQGSKRGAMAGQNQAAEAAPPPPPPPAPAPVAPAPAGDPTVEKISQLAQLHASGALTDEEFAAAKAQALGIG
jgi:putative oligomerization/nucleic acid binding protein